MNLYQALLMDHYKNPRNQGRLPAPDFVSEEHNPSCGDQVRMEGMLEGDVIIKIVFEGKGCVISQATASLLTVHVVGFSRAMIESMDSTSIQKLIGMELGPTRLKCALLPLHALQQGLLRYYLAHQQT